MSQCNGQGCIRDLVGPGQPQRKVRRSEIDAQEKFISFLKVGVLTRVMSGHDTASLETGAGARAANTQVDDLGEVIRSLDKKAQGEFSLRFLVAARSVDDWRRDLQGKEPKAAYELVIADDTVSAYEAFAALFAEGETTIGNIRQIDRGYERIDERLRALGASIERSEI